jgi:hypothetical protein
MGAKRETNSAQSVFPCSMMTGERTTVDVGVDTTTGRADMTLSLALETARCCDPTDGVSWGDGADSCCLTSLNVMVLSVDGSTDLQVTSLLPPQYSDTLVVVPPLTVRCGIQGVRTTSIYASRAYSPSGAYLSISDASAADGALTAHYDLTTPTATLHWGVLGRLGVLASGQIAASGPGSFQVTLDADMAAPTVQLLMWYTAVG